MNFLFTFLFILLAFSFVFLSPEKTLYLIRGIPGTGKSTLAARLTLNNVAADDFPNLYQNGVYNPALQKDAHPWCLNEVEAMMKKGKRRIAVHNTFCKTQNTTAYVALAQSYGYAVQIITCEAVIYPDNSHAISVHNVPLDTLERMKTSFERL